MARIRVYDLPTRLFHWSYAVGLASTLGIAATTDHHGPVFPYHKIIGLIVIVMVLLRLVWGFVGTRYARFASFLLKPRDLIAYLKGVFTGSGQLHAGHNPASSMAALTMFGLTVVIVTCGVLMSFGYSVLDDVHVVLAYLLLTIISAHIAGVILHTIQHRDNIAASMFTGFKRRDTGQPIASTRPLIAGVFVLVTVLWAGGLFHNYDPSTGQVHLPLLGTPIQVGC